MKLHENRFVPDEFLYCKLCINEKKFSSLTSIASHISGKHKIKTQIYYDMFFKKSQEGRCIWCEKETSYRHWSYNRYCGTKCKNAHYYSIPENLEKHRTLSYGVKTREKMRESAKNKLTMEYRSKISEKIKYIYRNNPKIKNIISLKTSQAIKEGKLRKKYIYDEEIFQSYDEVCFYIYLKEHEIRFKHLTDVSIEYKCNENVHHYFPDFKVYNTFVEIKGRHFFKDGKMINPFDRSQDDLYEAKHQCMINNKVKIITDCKKYINYVNEKYDYNFRKSIIQ